ncbi:hypothetical protein HanHA89_Chr02g0043611 [Helianthus annuus]|nr:hypothetical protein HanHA89_Chr02g0043611 [Helianthus annuus]
MDFSIDPTGRSTMVSKTIVEKQIKTYLVRMNMVYVIYYLMTWDPILHHVLELSRTPIELLYGLLTLRHC